MNLNWVQVLFIVVFYARVFHDMEWGNACELWHTDLRTLYRLSA